jgi:hypothetical protein
MGAVELHIYRVLTEEGSGTFYVVAGKKWLILLHDRSISSEVIGSVPRARAVLGGEKSAGA